MNDTKPCLKAPRGWYCTRPEGHEGPCAADRMITPWTSPGPSMEPARPVIEAAGFYCEKCKTLCSPYEQGLSCDCGPRWETEQYREETYPENWKRVIIKAWLQG